VACALPLAWVLDCPELEALVLPLPLDDWLV